MPCSNVIEMSIVFICYSCFSVYENHLKCPQQRVGNQLVKKMAYQIKYSISYYSIGFENICWGEM
jgi:hypothetical protein